MSNWIALRRTSRVRNMLTTSSPLFIFSPVVGRANTGVKVYTYQLGWWCRVFFFIIFKKEKCDKVIRGTRPAFRRGKRLKSSWLENWLKGARTKDKCKKAFKPRLHIRSREANQVLRVGGNAKRVALTPQE